MVEPIDYTLAQHQSDSYPIWEQSEGHIASFWYYLVCLLLSWLLLPALLGLIRYLQVRNHVYTLTTQRLSERSGIIFVRSDTCELYRVKDISVELPLLQRLLGCGNVILTTSDVSTPYIVLEAVHDPMAVADLMRDNVERCRVAKGVREFN
jgi:membrane protein YdbS with pleckstrin-like domain